MKQSPLESAHLEAGARMVAFAGWNMPVQYDGILQEHKAVREAAGIFDISHMGQIWIRGAEAAAWLNGLLTNDVTKLQADGEGQYTLMLNPEGGVIDDLIIYRESAESYFAVVNASRVDEDYAWMQEHAAEGVELENVSEDFAAIAVQGPKSAEVFASMVPGTQLPERFHMAQIKVGESEIIVCRTGYTGEDGFEFFCPTAEATDWWTKAVEGGAKPCGLGARDSLRLEKCYPLNGNDLTREHTPLEAGLGFFVDLEKGDFIGREVLQKQKADGIPFRLVAIKLTQKGPPPRPHYAVCQGEEVLGELSSGSVSPSLGTGIGMAYVPTGKHRVGTEVEIDVRGKKYSAQIVKKPFL